jgi:hypothetical protein
MTTWGQQARRHWRRGWRLARQGGQQVSRVAARTAQQARDAGSALARQVIGAQRSAGLDQFRAGQKLMCRSAESVTQRRGPQLDLHWSAGYQEVAASAGLLGPAPAQEREPEAGG